MGTSLWRALASGGRGGGRGRFQLGGDVCVGGGYDARGDPRSDRRPHDSHDSNDDGSGSIRIPQSSVPELNLPGMGLLSSTFQLNLSRFVIEFGGW